MLSHQGVEVFENTRGCCLIEVGMALLEESLSLGLGNEVSKAHAKSRFSAILSLDQSVAHLACSLPLKL